LNENAAQMHDCRGDFENLQSEVKFISISNLERQVAIMKDRFEVAS